MFKIITKKKYKALLSEIENLKELPSKYKKIEPENRKIIVLRAERQFDALSKWYEIAAVYNCLAYEILQEMMREGLFVRSKVENLPGFRQKIAMEICVIEPNRK